VKTLGIRRVVSAICKDFAGVEIAVFAISIKKINLKAVVSSPGLPTFFCDFALPSG
jgi:hypothetical protein